MPILQVGNSESEFVKGFDRFTASGLDLFSENSSRWSEIKLSKFKIKDKVIRASYEKNVKDINYTRAVR